MGQSGDVVYAIAWEQLTFGDGADMRTVGPEAVLRGDAVAWHGALVRLVRRAPVLQLRRAGSGPPCTPDDAGDLHAASAADAFLPRGGMILTDGQRAFRVWPLRRATGRGWLLVFLGAPPPRATPLWVVRKDEPATRVATEARGLLPGTPVLTARGPVPVETLRPGDRLDLACGSGATLVRLDTRQIGGAALYLAPDARPLWVDPGAFGKPGAPLRVAPDQAIGLDGPAVETLFPESPVLARARDLRATGAAKPDLAEVAVRYVLPVLSRPGLIVSDGGLPLEAGCASAAPWRQLSAAEVAILSHAISHALTCAPAHTLPRGPAPWPGGSRPVLQSRSSSAPTPQSAVLGAQPR